MRLFGQFLKGIFFGFLYMACNNHPLCPMKTPIFLFPILFFGLCVPKGASQISSKNKSNNPVLLWLAAFRPLTTGMVE